MAKNYNVVVNVTMAVTVTVQAENEDQAETIASNYVADSPENYINNDGHFVDSEVVDVNETD